jgi:nucleotide-binding universal stress UspA family protein
MATRTDPSILVCWDPTTERTPALFWAADTARSYGHQLVVFSSYAALRESLPSDAYRAAREGHETDVAAFASEVTDAGGACSIESTNDDVRVDLIDHARQHRAEMIVVGADSTSSGPGLFHLGSVTEFLAHHSAIPLAVIRAAVVPPERLAVFVDGSDEGVAAVRWAAVHARHTDSDVTPVVLEAGMRGAPQLLAAAEDLDADVIVIGAPPLLEVLGRRVGGVGLKVLHTTDRSVVLVPGT